MYLHANAKLGLAGRLALVRAVEDGLSLKAAAAAFSVSPATAHRWWHRWLEAGEEARRTLSCLFDRSSRPHRSPRQLAPELEQRDLRLPPRDRLGTAPGRRRDRLRALDGLEGAQAGRASRGRRRRPRSRPTATSGPAPAICCTWTQAATRASCGPATVSPATARSARAVGASRRGSATTTRTRSSTTTRGSPTSSSTTTRKPRPSPASSNERSPSSPTRHHREAADDRQRLRLRHSRSLRELLARHGIRHLTTKPYRPRTNGKVERFHQTMAREWAYGLAYRSHRHRNRRPATLARPLQPATATQLTRRPAPDQPRSQRPWVGHLAR